MLEGHGGLFVGAGFEINQAGVVERARIVVETLGDFETFDGFVVFLFFRVENTEAIVGGGVFLVEFKNSQEGFLGAERLAFFHGSLGDGPEFLHLDVVFHGLFFDRLFAVEKRRKNNKRKSNHKESVGGQHI